MNDEIKWFNEELVYDRLFELYEYLENLPNGWYAPIARKEIEMLERLVIV